MFAIEKQLSIHWTIVARWHRAGELNEATIDAHLTERGARRRSREVARANKVSDAARRMRVSRGWSRDVAAMDWRAVLP
jgi:hypothetical protein